MRQLKKTKLYKLSLLLLGAIVLAGFGFCPMPLAVRAQSLEAYEEPDAGIFRALGESPAENCNDVGHGSKTGTIEFQKTEAVPGGEAQSENAVLPCCLDHDKITKIDSAPSFEANDFFFRPSWEKNIPDLDVPNRNLSYVHSLDLPPPEGGFLDPILKKE